MPETTGKVWSKNLGQEDLVREHVNKLDIHKVMGPDRMHPVVLKKLANVIVRQLSIGNIERLW